nr:PREDICTED: uncharacterized protein LOC109032781 [Bemisia tabaci]
MYRMILIAPEDRSLQRILWRENPNDSVKVFELNTVTYGTGPAPFLAIRALQESANIQEENLPIGAYHVKKSFYVDDFLGRADTVEEARQVKKEVEAVTSSNNFLLRKWASNDSTILKTGAQQTEPLYFNDNRDIKVFGLEWHPATDIFCFSARHKATSVVTKRIILSEISKLFDPLGIVGSILVRAKMLIQDLWKLKLTWDEPVPDVIKKKWMELADDLAMLTEFSVPRHVQISRRTKKLVFHGFGDASKGAYGACIYVVSYNADSPTSILLCSKSRVASLKLLTIPRLELLAALLLARLMKRVLSAVNNHPHEIFLWSDSMDVLYWLQKPPDTWHTFVANRVSEIQAFTSEVHASWKYVPTKENPADLISRGVSSAMLKKSDLWKSGPHWLTSDSRFWPKQSINPPSNGQSEEKVVRVFLGIQSFFSSLNVLLDRVSSLSKLLRIVAYVLRFVNNVGRKNTKNTSQILLPEELDNAQDVCTKSIQHQVFNQDIHDLMSPQGELRGSSSIKTLNPFMDSKGLLRVGGRLKNSNLPLGEKHPVLLPAHHKLTELIIREKHERLGHAAPQALLASVRQSFWPLQGKRMAQKIAARCMTCIRAKPKLSSQMIGQLPLERVVPAPAFTSGGIDFAGPIKLRSSRTAKTSNKKAYLTLFVCFVTKAVHLELCPDLSAAGFIDTFKRFISRRGIPSLVFSDNAKTFVAADSHVQSCFDQFFKDSRVLNYLAVERI